MQNPFLLQTEQAAETRPFLMGVVNSITGGLYIKLDGETDARTKSFAILASYTPIVGHRVLVAKISGTYVVLGRVM